VCLYKKFLLESNENGELGKNKNIKEECGMCGGKRIERMLEKGIISEHIAAHIFIFNFPHCMHEMFTVLCD